MESKYINFRAPGSLMILGEYAVLHQGFGVCCAIDQYMTAKLNLRSDRIITLKSHLGSYEGSLDHLPDSESLSFAVQSIRKFLSFCTCGFDIEYISTIDTQIGFGSSAATVVSTLGALNLAFFKSVDHERILKMAVDTVISVQGSGSGCDCAASLYQSTVAFNPRTFEVKRFHHPFELTVLYSGQKASTKKMIQFVHQRYLENKEAVAKIYNEIESLTNLGMRSLFNNDLHRLGEIITSHHYKLRDLGVSNPDLEALIQILLKDSAILGAKISGAGGGDCVIGLGGAIVNLPIDMYGSRVIHVKTLTGTYI